MIYFTYNMLNMFRALLFPSSGARDYITAYGVRCLRCWRSGAGEHAMRPWMRDVVRATSFITDA